MSVGIGTKAWHRKWRFGRVQVGFHLYKHVYGPSVSDRWVLQPFAIFDRKENATKGNT